jgi:hypothetical protein
VTPAYAFQAFQIPSGCRRGRSTSGCVVGLSRGMRRDTGVAMVLMFKRPGVALVREPN